jgi:membrane associated rhomboid family serine protease
LTQWLVYLAVMADPDRTDVTPPLPGQNPPEPNPSGQDPSGDRPAPAFNLHGAIILMAGLCVGIHLMRTLVFDGQIDRWLIGNFAFFPIRYAPDYFQLDWPTLFSPFTHTLLHGDWVHLGFNMIWLVAFGAPVAYRLGWTRTIALWAITALGAVALHTALYFGDWVPLLGASGAVSGFLGAAARFGFRADRRNPRRGFAGPLLPPLASLRQRGVLAFILVWMAINYATGADLFGMAGGASIAWEAHIGGLLTGFFAIGWLDRHPPARRLA